MTKRRQSIEGSSTSSAPASAVWAAWTNPPEWPGGIIEAAKIDGDFVVGATITTKAGGPTTKITVTSMDPPRMWVGVARFPGLTLTAEHLIEPAGDTTVLTERVTTSGPLGGVAARLIGKRLAAGFVQTTARIARLAESQSSG
jgi:hypothetical protein